VIKVLGRASAQLIYGLMEEDLGEGGAFCPVGTWDWVHPQKGCLNRFAEMKV